MIEYANVPRIVGVIVSHNKATLKELSTFYGVKDGYDLLEIIAVNNHNERLMRENR